MKVFKPPHSYSVNDQQFAVFLAGSIEMGKAEDWQERITRSFQSEEICFLNPRRDDWDSSWEQRIDHPAFNEQVTWELDALEAANLIVFYFSPETTSPVSMLELGLFARSSKVIVCCPEGFWRKGNVDIVCHRWNIPQVETLEALIAAIDKRLKNH